MFRRSVSIFFCTSTTGTSVTMPSTLSSRSRTFFSRSSRVSVNSGFKRNSFSEGSFFTSARFLAVSCRMASMAFIRRCACSKAASPSRGSLGASREGASEAGGGGAGCAFGATAWPFGADCARRCLGAAGAWSRNSSAMPSRLADWARTGVTDTSNAAVADQMTRSMGVRLECCMGSHLSRRF